MLSSYLEKYLFFIKNKIDKQTLRKRVMIINKNKNSSVIKISSHKF